MDFGLFKRLKNKIDDYQPEIYWHERGKEYQKKFQYTDSFREQEEIFIKVLSNLSFDSVLEFGCGFGRITRLVLENFSIKNYVAFDLSPHQIENANKNCKSYDVEFQVSTIENFKSKKKFDLVFGSEVLLHVKPENIHQIMKHLLSYSKKNMINIDLFPLETPKKIAPHNFIHPYKEIYLETENVKNVKIFRINDSQCIFNAKML